MFKTPIPKRRKGEKKKAFASRVISAERKAGKPHKQAIAIGMRTAKLPKPKGKKKR